MWNFEWSWWFGLGISKGSNLILWNFHGWSFVLSGISRSKVKEIKIPGEFQKSIPSNPLLVFRCWSNASSNLQQSTLIKRIFIRRKS